MKCVLVFVPQDDRRPAKVAVGPQSTVHMSTVSRHYLSVW